MLTHCMCTLRGVDPAPFTTIREQLQEVEPEALFAHDLDDALVGIVRQAHRLFACYSMKKIIEILMERDQMSITDALEFYDYNIVGAFVGEYTPVFLQDY